MSDPFNLQRFVDAQNVIFETVLVELGRGRKSSHWMWYIFPQIRGLGLSFMSEKFAISSIGEAEAYLNDPILGLRLRQCTKLVVDTADRTIDEIFGYPDDMKFHSSMTLFAHATSDNEIFRTALQKFFRGKEDSATLKLLSLT